MIDGSGLGTAELQFVALLHARDKVFGCLVRAGLAADHQDLRIIGAARNRSHVLDFELGFSLSHGDRVTHREGHYCVAIGWPRHEIVHCRSTTTATFVYHDHVLFKCSATA